MIQLRMNGRAGNQLFQYATIYAYMRENNCNEELNISFQDLQKRKTDENTFVDILRYFEIPKYNTIDKVYMTFFQKVLDFLYRVTVKIIRKIKKIKKKSLDYNDYKFIDTIWHKILNRNGLYYYMPTNFKFYDSKNSNIIFFGSFESKEFFDKYKEELIEMFKPKMTKNEENFRIIREN